MTAAMLRSPSHYQIWWLFLLQGIAGILLGAMLLSDPAATLVALVTFLGFYWQISGVLSLVQAFVDRSAHWGWSVLSGLLGIAAGMLVLRHPLLAALTVPTIIVVVLGVQALVMGAVNIIHGVQGGGAASFILGVFNILIGLLLLSSPLTAALAVPFVFGILLLAQGIMLTFWAFRLRRI